MIESKWSENGDDTVFYRLDETDGLEYLKAAHPWLTTENIELIGVSDKSINITYDARPDDKILALFGVTQNHVYCDYYAIEFYKNGKEVLKIYDQDLSKHPLPGLPPGARLDPLGSGIGIYYPEEELSMAKIYFLHDDPEFVHKWWGSKNYPEQISRLTYFGIEFDRKTLLTTDISQYSIYKDEDLG
jgi:hypothetical protein